MSLLKNVIALWSFGRILDGKAVAKIINDEREDLVLNGSQTCDMAGELVSDLFDEVHSFIEQRDQESWLHGAIHHLRQLDPTPEILDKLRELELDLCSKTQPIGIVRKVGALVWNGQKFTEPKNKQPNQ